MSFDEIFDLTAGVYIYIFFMLLFEFGIELSMIRNQVANKCDFP